MSLWKKLNMDVMFFPLLLLLLRPVLHPADTSGLLSVLPTTASLSWADCTSGNLSMRVGLFIIIIIVIKTVMFSFSQWCHCQQSNLLSSFPSSSVGELPGNEKTAFPSRVCVIYPEVCAQIQRPSPL